MKSKIIQYLLPVLLSRGAGILIGVLCIITLIMLAGHQVGLDRQQRIIASVAVVVVYLLALIIRRLFVWNKGRMLSKKLRGDQAEDGSEDPVAQKLDHVISQLKSTHLGTQYKGASAMYALPWYMVVGPSAAGKSTLFARSGLHFPLRDDERLHVSGIGGTRDCDWWFCDEAILIDTAGRYTQEEDNAEWLGFLRLLKENRPKLPVNGVMLALPLDQILLSSPEEKKEHVKHLRARIHEIINELGVMFPIYIVLTKCDLLRGFEDFFEDLSDTEVKQPWGVYLLEETEDKSVDILALIRERLNALHSRLLEQRTSKMNLARNRDQRINIYHFPTQFAGALEKLEEFTSLLFKNNPYHEKPWFAGIYFTSGTQEGVPLERKSNALLSIFKKMPGAGRRNEDATRSYFIDHLFNKVIFPLQSAVRGNRKRERFHQAAKALTGVMALFVAVAAAFALSGLYQNNLNLLRNYEQQAANLTQQLSDPMTTELERFDALVGIYGHFRSLETITTYSPIDIVARHDLMGTHAEPMQHLLASTLTHQIEAHALTRLHTELARLNAQWTDLGETERIAERARYYQLLESYLMLTSDQDQYDRASVAATLSELWLESIVPESLHSAYEKEQALMAEMASLYLRNVQEPRRSASNNPWRDETTLVTNAQDNLTTPTDADSLYQLLLAAAEVQFSDIDLHAIMDGTVAPTLDSEHAVPGAFTLDAWDTFVAHEIRDLSRQASMGDWVLGLTSPDGDSIVNTRQADALEAEVRQRYFQDYSAEWLQFIEGLSVPQFDSLADTVQATKALSDSSGPIAAVYNRIAAELEMTDPLLSAQDLVSQTSQHVSDSEDDPQPRLIPEFLQTTERLRRLVQPSDGQSSSPVTEVYLQEMADLAVELEFLLADADSDREAHRYAAELLSGDTAGKQLYSSQIATGNLISAMDNQSRSSVETLLMAPLSHAWGSLLNGAGRTLQQQWENDVFNAYTRNIQGRYPFSNSHSEASPNDVTAMFHPDEGDFWTFVEQDLDPFIQRGSNQWQPRQWLGQGIRFDSDFFRGIDNARAITDSLFDRSNRITMNFAVYPIQVPGVSESLFAVNGQTYRYRNEPQQWRDFTWEANTQSGRAQVNASSSGQNSAGLDESGPWALLRVLQAADTQQRQGNEYELSWNISNGGQSNTARFRVRIDREDNVVATPPAGRMQLPARITGG